MTEKIKTLIVDDSAFARSIIVKRLGVDSDIEVIGVAKDGIDALEKMPGAPRGRQCPRRFDAFLITSQMGGPSDLGRRS